MNKRSFIIPALALLLFAVAVLMPSCSGKEPQTSGCVEQTFDGTFTPEPEKLYEAVVYITALDSEGFACTGAFQGGAWVSSPGASERFHISEQIRMEFYGKDCAHTEKRIAVDGGGAGRKETVCAWTVREVVSANPDPALYADAKPIIYLYPEKETVCSVFLDFDGEITCSYPEHGARGWSSFTARPDGTLLFPDGGEYYALYWEGDEKGKVFDFSSGFCVPGEATAEFLGETLPKLGLSPREANEFIIYWLPRMQENAYNLISFQGKAYTDVARLTVDPAPDTVIRVFMAYIALDNPVGIAPQEFAAPERTGFTLVEWGGCEVK